MPTMGHESFEIWLGHFKWSEGPGFGRDGRDVDSVIELYERRLHDISKYGEYVSGMVLTYRFRSV
jgi:hypothetical protein